MTGAAVPGSHPHSPLPVAEPSSAAIAAAAPREAQHTPGERLRARPGRQSPARGSEPTGACGATVWRAMGALSIYSCAASGPEGRPSPTWGLASPTFSPTLPLLCGPMSLSAVVWRIAVGVLLRCCRLIVRPGIVSSRACETNSNAELPAARASHGGHASASFASS